MPKRSPIPREEHDFYRTPPGCTRGLLSVERFAGPIWEPACGDGAISDVLVGAGLDVFNTDLIDRGCGFAGVDFLNESTLCAPDIVTNPPYKLADEFALHAVSQLGARKVAMLLRLSWLEGERRRRKVFDVAPPSRIWVLSARPTLWHGTDPNARTTGGAISYAWFVWDSTAAPGSPVLGWIPRADSVSPGSTP
jgi:hypothetical protein